MSDIAAERIEAAKAAWARHWRNRCNPRTGGIPTATLLYPCDHNHDLVFGEVLAAADAVFPQPSRLVGAIHCPTCDKAFEVDEDLAVSPQPEYVQITEPTPYSFPVFRMRSEDV